MLLAVERDTVYLVGVILAFVAFGMLLAFLHFNRRTAKIETKLGSIAFGEEQAQQIASAAGRLESVQATVGGLYAAVNGVTEQDTETLRQLMKRSVALSESTQAKVDGLGQSLANLDARFGEHLAFHAGADAIKAAGEPATGEPAPSV